MGDIVKWDTSLFKDWSSYDLSDRIFPGNDPDDSFLTALLVAVRAGVSALGAIRSGVSALGAIRSGVSALGAVMGASVSVFRAVIMGASVSVLRAVIVVVVNGYRNINRSRFFL